jgi:hypothetical protein
VDVGGGEERVREGRERGAKGWLESEGKERGGRRVGKASRTRVEEDKKGNRTFRGSGTADEIWVGRGVMEKSIFKGTIECEYE